MMLDLYGHMERNRQYFMNSNLCRICGYRNNNTEFIAREMNFGMKDEFTYFICNKCGCIQIAAKPDDLSAYYDTNRYYSFQRSDESDKNKLIPALIKLRNLSYTNAIKYLPFKMLAKVFPLKDSPLRSILGQKKALKKSVLDVGCGEGEFLSRLKEFGYSSLTGIDPFIAEENSKYGFKIYKTDILGFNPGKKFDVILFNHSFEHIYEEKETLKKAADLLERNGKIIISLPIIGNPWKEYGTNWVELDPPRHFYLHTNSSIQCLAEDCDLKVSKVYYDGEVFQYIGSEMYKRGIPLSQQTWNLIKKELGEDNMKELRKKVKIENKSGEGAGRATYVLSKQQE